jgi:glutamine cyclotransferase
VSTPSHGAVRGRRFRYTWAAILLAGVLGATVACAQWSRVPVVRPKILAEIPHDTAAFTQGLLWLDGKLYESTGLYGSSSLRELDPATGAVTRRQRLPPQYFAEGLAWFRGEFIQITWKEGEALRWPRVGWELPASSRRFPRFQYAGEGWGLAAEGAALWMSNGSDTLYRRDASFRITAKTGVRWNGVPLARLNELEAARGRIIANVWYSDSLFVIDPRDGRVLAVVDGAEIAARSRRRSVHDVMNGVAWDPVKDEFYVTGKNWPVMFKVKIPGF